MFIGKAGADYGICGEMMAFRASDGAGASILFRVLEKLGRTRGRTPPALYTEAARPGRATASMKSRGC